MPGGMLTSVLYMYETPAVRLFDRSDNFPPVSASTAQVFEVD